MANMCGIHHPSRGPVEGCRLCHTHPREVFPGWDQKTAEAEAAGKHTCLRCGFVYYRTINTCPTGCGEPLPERPSPGTGERGGEAG